MFHLHGLISEAVWNCFYCHLSFQSHGTVTIHAQAEQNCCREGWRHAHHRPPNVSRSPSATKPSRRPGAGEFWDVHSVLPLLNSVEVGGGGGSGEEWDWLAAEETCSDGCGMQAACLHFPHTQPTDVRRCAEHYYSFRTLRSRSRTCVYLQHQFPYQNTAVTIIITCWKTHFTTVPKYGGDCRC